MESEKCRITPAMFAAAVGMDAQAVRVGMQQGKLDLGIAYKPTDRNYTYVIFPEKVRAIVGDKQMEAWGY